MKRANAIQRTLAKYGREIARGHLVMGAMGNISAREAKTVWIKRGGAWLERAKPDDFVAVDVRSREAKFSQTPSKEIFLHLGCYKAKAGLRAVVHTHPVMATALATAGINLNRTSPRLCKRVGSKIVTLKYYSPGSKKLACQVQQAIKLANVVLLANHGLVTVGRNVKEAYQRTCYCEQEAKRILSRLRRE